ncbi:hypothetical protein DM47_3323 [Burkholderia mallei]|nr:hypothetical protein DO73_5109 [Burkholderia pseudomallei]KGD07998.1 hypothetical protein DP42_5442 [Burkholderia pseudomallei]KGD16114.1 hypothetical protein DO70_4660 [Burkholderia pseudomallei]KOT02790.1 hypothetical protein DM50_3972 [Burkholderia mallei]KOT16540.1 hypothetical protein DM47_3323 [Burkholderia mallei]
MVVTRIAGRDLCADSACGDEKNGGDAGRCVMHVFLQLRLVRFE